MSLNKVLLVGNLTRDPEMRQLAPGRLMVRMGMAVNRQWVDKDGNKCEEASFFNIVAHEEKAEILVKYAKKGRRLFIEGRLTARTVTNDKGETRTYHDITVCEFQFLDRKADGRQS